MPPPMEGERPREPYIFASRENNGLIVSLQPGRELNRQVAEFAKDFRADAARKSGRPSDSAQAFCQGSSLGTIPKVGGAFHRAEAIADGVRLFIHIPVEHNRKVASGSGLIPAPEAGPLHPSPGAARLPEPAP